MAWTLTAGGDQLPAGAEAVLEATVKALVQGYDPAAVVTFTADQVTPPSGGPDAAPDAASGSPAAVGV